MPFKNWALPGALGRLRRRVAGHDVGDRQVVQIFNAVVIDGLSGVQAACAETLNADTVSAHVVLNALARQQSPAPIITPERLELDTPPLADCARYDTQLGWPSHTAQLEVA